jgi:hypothetical protein
MQKTKTARLFPDEPFRLSNELYLDAAIVALPQPASGFSTGNEHGYTVT